MNLLTLSKYGLYCPKGDFYIDASGRVDRNIVTHAHADHARPGHRSYLANELSVPLLLGRLGKKNKIESLPYNRTIKINDVKVSLHPAGHVYGSSQVKISYKDEVWVVSGDYKLEDDYLSTPFEPVRCNTFITECTFGLPVYHWPDQDVVYRKIDSWWKENKASGVTSLLFGYSLGKSQRIIKNIDHDIGPVFVHKPVALMNDAIRSTGGSLPETITIKEGMDVKAMNGNLIIAPPSITTGRLLHGIGPISTAMASGWAQSGRNFGRSNVTRGFILSDHADWDGLLKAIGMTEAEQIFTMHGYTHELSRFLNEEGTRSFELDELKNLPYKL